MGEISKIQWTDSTVNFWSGCTKVSAGCAKCYAEARDKRHMIEKVDHWGKGAPRLKHKGAVKDALAFNRKPWICNQCGEGFADKYAVLDTEKGCFHTAGFHRRRIFSLSLGDWLDEEVPIEWLAEMLDTIRKCDQCTWILCTKRPELWRSRLDSVIAEWAHQEVGPGPYSDLGMDREQWAINWLNGDAPKNIILLTSVENQEQADIRIPKLLDIPAVCRGLSLEPLLGPVDLHPRPAGGTGMCRACGKINEYPKVGWPECSCGVSGRDGHRGFSAYEALNWLIIGGESGDGARACDVGWIRSLVEQGKAARVATFVKQLGAKPICSVGWTGPFERIKHPKGGDPEEWPEDLRVQEFPEL